uniref:intercellular adhesion molecule 3-like n=1 Tax=Scatophagus argus TaxID=75038 RepID=UPI001ED86245|nr:intercellular adhesion molecule 3-like [Scatophagus argus]
MSASGWRVTLLLLNLFGSAIPSPVPVYTPAPLLPSQISPPSRSPTILPFLPSPALSIAHRIPPPDSNSGELTLKDRCPLTMSPSALVVRFGDPVTANCSVQKMGFSLLGWEVSLAPPEPTMDHFLVWKVDNITTWNIEPMCYALSDQGGQCHLKLPLKVYKPPDKVTISLVNHTGSLYEGHQYSLRCTVHDVAPVENLVVTFYRGQTALSQLQSSSSSNNNNNNTENPFTEFFTLNITPTKDDDGVQYWCEAKLELGPEGPQHPPVVKSQKFTATVLFGPQLVCPTKLQVREGESLSCEVRGNPPPSVTWFRDGQVVTPPTSSSRKHAGKYTVLVKGFLEQRNFTVEVEVLEGSGPANSYNADVLLAVGLLQVINWL